MPSAALSKLRRRTGLSLVLEYTPPIIPPVLQMKLAQGVGQVVLRLEWTSRSDCFDLLQTQSQLLPNGWSDVETISGTGETLTRDVPATNPVAFYRVQRELK